MSGSTTKTTGTDENVKILGLYNFVKPQWQDGDLIQICSYTPDNPQTITIRGSWKIDHHWATTNKPKHIIPLRKEKHNNGAQA